MLYTITMPGKMYRALRERNALENLNAKDQAAFAVFKEAVPRRMGHGHRFVITGEEEIIEYILDYLHSLLGLAEGGDVPSYEFGAGLQTFRRVVNQVPAPVDFKLHCST